MEEALNQAMTSGARPPTWEADTAPMFPDALIFGGSTRLTPTNDFENATVTNLSFAAGAGAFTLMGNSITLSGNVSIAVASGVPTNNQTINMPLALGADISFTAAATRGDYAPAKGALILNGTISGPFGLTAGGKNFVQFNGANTYTGDTTLMAVGSDTSIAIGSDYAFGSGLVKFGLPGSGQQWIVSSGGDHTITNDVDIQTGLFVAQNSTVGGKGSGVLTLTGNILVHASSGFYMNADHLNLFGPIRGGSSAANMFELRAGKLCLGGDNSFTNTITITNLGYGSARILNIISDACLGHTNNAVRFKASGTIQTPASSNIILTASRTFDVTSGAAATFDIPTGSTLTLNGPVINSGAVIKTSSGTLALNGLNTYTGGTTLRGGTLLIPADSGLGSEPAAPATSLQFLAGSTLMAGANHTLSANRLLFIGTNVTATFDTQSYTQTVNGTVSGGPGSWLVKNGNGTLALDPGAGNSNVVCSLKPQAGTLTFLSGMNLITSNTVWSTYPVYDIFYINGGNVLVGGGTLMTTGDGYATIRNGSLTVTNGTVDLNSLRELLNAYSGTGNTTVGGSGTLDLNTLRITQSGTPAVSNVVNVNAGGRIRLKNFAIDTGFPQPYGTVNLNGGTLEAKVSTDGFMGYNVGKWTTNVFFYVLSGGAIIDSGTNAVTAQLPLYSGAENDGGLTKRGIGLLALANTNTYTGATSVDEGTLRLGVANTLPTDSSVFVNSNAVLDVNGKVQTLATLSGHGVVSNNTLLTVAQAIAPGGTNSVGTLTFATTPTALEGTLSVAVTADGTCDRLHVCGNLDLTGMTLALTHSDLLDKHIQYVLASCTGTLTGPFLSAPLPQRWHIRYDAVGEARLSYDFGLRLSIK